MGRTAYGNGSESVVGSRLARVKGLIELALADSHVVLVGDLLTQEVSLLQPNYVCSYKSNTKDFLLALGTFLNFQPEKQTIAAYKEAIAAVANHQVVVVLNAQRLPPALRFWLVDLSFRLILQCPIHPKKDVFLDLVAIEVPPLSTAEAISLIAAEAQAVGLRLSSRRLHALAVNCASPTAAKVMVRREKLGLDHDFKHLPGEYLDISPLFMAMLAAFGVFRFVGLATSDRLLYVVGGVAMMVGLSLRYLGRLGKK